MPYLERPINHPDQVSAVDYGYVRGGQRRSVGGNPLVADHLAEPIIQVSADTGTTWFHVPFTSDYTSQLTGHLIRGGAQPPSTKEKNNKK